MTCIVGFEYNNSVWIGGDSAGVCKDFVSIRSDKKVFINQDYVFGFTGSFRMGQVLRFRFDPPKWNGTDCLEKFMVVDFIDALKNELKSNSDATEGCTGFLVGYQGKLFEVDTDYQIAISAYPYTAIGAGKELAMGSLYTTCSLDMPVEQKLLTALQVAQEFCSSVREPFYIERMNK
ncbi:MAG: hypothetical protein HC836_37060 [Richelia sp. RM2_1_2]|nr:hypothetical protein [Richelia sp. RM2_1_2]